MVEQKKRKIKQQLESTTHLIRLGTPFYCTLT